MINLPALDEIVYAGRGLGCFCNGTPVRVSDRADLVDAVPHDQRGRRLARADTLLAMLRSPVRLRTWGDGWGYALVATGRVEAMVDIGSPSTTSPRCS